MGLGGDHAGQVGRPPGGRDDHLDAGGGSSARKGPHAFGRSVGRDDVHQMRNPKKIQQLVRSAYGRPIAAAAHH